MAKQDPGLTRIEIDGHWGTMAYFDDNFEMTDLEHATLAKVVLDDGGNVFYAVNATTDTENQHE